MSMYDNGGGGGGDKTLADEAQAVEALPDGPKAEGAPKLVTVLCPNTWACPAAVMALTVVLLFSGLTGGQDTAEALDDSVAGLELITSPGANGETYFIKDPQALTKGKHTTVPLPPDYKVQFEFTPEGEVVKSWSSIVHFSATGNNCCSYGDRVPAVWFYPGSRRLHVIDGHGPIGNDECAITEELEVGTKYTVTIEGYQKVVDVSLNGVVKCTEPRQDRRGGGFSRATVYASDEWYEPAHGTIDNFYMVPLEPITGCTDFAACNHDGRASESDGSCVMQPRGSDCGGTHPIRTGNDGTTTLIPAGQQFALEQGSLHAVVPVPLDYTVSFTITPQPGLQESWSSIVHFTATGTNCCNYGDRVPGIWFWPGSRRLHVVDGMPSSGNANCNSDNGLTPGVEHHVAVSIGQGFVDVSVNGLSVCDGVRKDRRAFSTVHVYASDPWHVPALATISTLVMAPMVPRSGCMIDAACNRDFKASLPSTSCIYPTSGTDCTGQFPIEIEEVTGTTWFVREPAVPLTKYVEDLDGGGSGGMHATTFIPLDYSVEFTLLPTDTTESGWSSIFHFSATGANCCDYGDRVPGVWFYPGGDDTICARGNCPGHRLHVVHGSAQSGNDHCSPEEELPSNIPTTVRIDIRDTHVEVFFNNRMVCTEERGETNTWSPAHLMMADPWYPTAHASISNFKLSHLPPIVGCMNKMACNYDVRAGVDDSSCAIPERGFDCDGNQIGSADASGITQFVGTPGVRLAPPEDGGKHAVVSLPDDYTIGFKITPSTEVQDPWASIFHFSATGNNCCSYGDRIPGVWFYPGTRRLHIRDGSNSEGNAGCDQAEGELPAGVTTEVVISIHQTHVRVTLDGVQTCIADRSDRAIFPTVHVFVSDPWYVPALATIEDMWMRAD